MAAPAPTSRKREPIQGDEEAGAELKLGEFQDVDALSNSEAAIVINALVARRKLERKNVNDTEYVVLVESILRDPGLEGRARRDYVAINRQRVNIG
jgi:DNA-directed RNA polymerase II subunit RPB4